MTAVIVRTQEVKLVNHIFRLIYLFHIRTYVDTAAKALAEDYTDLLSRSSVLFDTYDASTAPYLMRRKKSML